MKPKFYDNSALLSKLDLNGNTPGTYICVGNRTAGKTFSFKTTLLNDFYERGMQFILIKRFVTGMTGVADAFFEDLKTNPYDTRFASIKWNTESLLRGSVREIYVSRMCGGDPNLLCGYAVYLGASDVIKENSTMFTHVENSMYDEFQSETEHYAPGELSKYLSIQTSIARGQGKQVRHVRKFLVSNAVTLFNPHFVALGIHKRLQPDTKFLRGDGWVLEYTRNESAKLAVMESDLARAYASSDYFSYASGDSMLLDTNTFIEKRSKENMTYHATLWSNGRFYGLWYDLTDGCYYCSVSGQKNAKMQIAIKTEDLRPGVMLFRAYPELANTWVTLFNEGRWRFENAECKNVMFDLLASRSV